MHHDPSPQLSSSSHVSSSLKFLACSDDLPNMQYLPFFGGIREIHWATKQAIGYGKSIEMHLSSYSLTHPKRDALILGE